MSPEKQRIAIAEACGWTDIVPERKHAVDSPEDFPCGTSPRGFEMRRLPYYLSDLNAMHEAEKSLTEAQREVYAWHLAHGDCSWYKSEPELRVPASSIGWIEMSAEDAFEVYHATAAQRAEAFLRATNKWEERP